MKLTVKKASLLLALIIIFTGLVSCEQKQEIMEVEVEYSFVNSMPLDESPNLSALPKIELGDDGKIQEKQALNEDSKGWLRVENTSLDDVVMYRNDDTDKFYYLRKDFFGNYLFEGTYFLDYRGEFEGGREGMPRNSVIYGHSMNDDPNDYIFSQLKKYKDQDFAKKTPYIYFSTLEEGDMAWEVFAVFVTNVDVPYNAPNLEDDKFMEVIKDVSEKSIYDYDVEVTTDDKILTLSTCLYEVNGQKVSYPNNYRYVIMAKLVPENEILRIEADFQINEDYVLA